MSNTYRGCLSNVYDRFEHPTDHFLDNVRHCDGDVISATKVREAYKLEDWKTIARLCPESTVECLKKLKNESV